MEYKIKELIYSFFRNVPDCAQMRTLRTELTRNMIRRYYHYISSGKTPGEAYDAILGCAQEIKDRIADVMRNIGASHAAPPFSGSGRTTRSYNADTQSKGSQTQKQKSSAGTADNDESARRAKSNARSHRENVRQDRPVKRPVSIPSALIIALVGAALTALAACGIFFVTQMAFSNPDINSRVEQPIREPASSDVPNQDSGSTPMQADTGAALTLGDAALQYRDMEQSFSEDGAYAIDAAHLAAVDKLELHWPAGKVWIHVYDGSDFLVLESAPDGVTQQQALCCGLEGNTLFVQYCSAQAAQTSLPVKDLEICIPQTLAGAAINADFILGDAALTLDDLSFTAAQIQTQGGCITANRLTAGTALLVETVSGDAVLSGMLKDVTFSSESGSLYMDNGDVLCSITAQTQSGNIDINASIHRLNASTYGGDVRIQAPICPYALDITTRSGGVALHIPAQSDFTLDFHSSSGSFISGLTLVETRGSYVRGDGIAGFRIETASGDLQIFAYAPAS